MFHRSLNPKDIIGLLSKLKAGTPEYPVDLLAKRRAAFLEQAIAINFYGKGHGGKGGGDGGSAGSAGSGGSGALGGTTTAQGFVLQAVVGMSVVAAMLTSAYLLRDQIVDLFQGNGIVSAEVTQAPLMEPTDTLIAPATETLPATVTITAVTITPSGTPGAETGSEDPSEIQNVPDGTKDNSGLHLGQTPGPPQPPNQDKPDKPDKPKKNK